MNRPSDSDGEADQSNSPDSAHSTQDKPLEVGHTSHQQRHGEINPTQQETQHKKFTEPHTADGQGYPDHILTTRFESDRRRLLADAATYQAAMIKFNMSSHGVPRIPGGPESLYVPSVDAKARMADYLTQMAYLQEHSAPRVEHSSRGSAGDSPPSEESEGENGVVTSPNADGSTQWTFEEQFKPLYDMDTEPERKAFLDELFAFMQKKGTPVNRIPIMAKQTLDIYQLFKLVVAKGGLVEVINKKLWREITKGLNLPSSITSAAFTLRTQYMKYLYTYEREKHGFSSSPELQAAIDGNRREGRRPGYGYELGPGGLPMLYPQPSLAAPSFFNPALLSNAMSGMMNQMVPSSSGIFPGLSNHLKTPPHLNGGTPLSASTADKDENSLRLPTLHPMASPRLSAFSLTRPLHDSDTLNRDTKRYRPDGIPHTNGFHRVIGENEREEDKPTPPSKHRPSIGSTNIKVTSQEDDSDGSASLVVTMDINGTTYQGVLFAQKVDESIDD